MLKIPFSTGEWSVSPKQKCKAWASTVILYYQNTSFETRLWRQETLQGLSNEKVHFQNSCQLASGFCLHNFYPGLQGISCETLAKEQNHHVLLHIPRCACSVPKIPGGYLMSTICTICLPVEFNPSKCKPRGVVTSRGLNMANHLVELYTSLRDPNLWQRNEGAKLSTHIHPWVPHMSSIMTNHGCPFSASTLGMWASQDLALSGLWQFCLCSTVWCHGAE